jgi:hypothetical protein
MHREVQAETGVETGDEGSALDDPNNDLARDLDNLADRTDPAGSSPLRLFRFERRWLTRIFQAILPSGAHPRMPLGARDVPAGRFVDDLLASAPLLSVLGLRAALWLVMAAPLFGRRPGTFAGLGAGGRVALLDRLRRSDRYLVRQAVTLLKVVACLAVCGLGPVQRRLGVHPTDATPPPWARRPR